METHPFGDPYPKTRRDRHYKLILNEPQAIHTGVSHLLVASRSALSGSERDSPVVTWPWVKIQIAPPVNIPIPTKTGSKMGGEFSYQPKWDWFKWGVHLPTKMGNGFDPIPLALTTAARSRPLTRLSLASLSLRHCHHPSPSPARLMNELQARVKCLGGNRGQVTQGKACEPILS